MIKAALSRHELFMPALICFGRRPADPLDQLLAAMSASTLIALSPSSLTLSNRGKSSLLLLLHLI
jgi:hypothetical protein